MKRIDPRRVKIHRTYTVNEAADLLKVHENTVRSWLKAGLDTVDDQRPILIKGQDLLDFLRDRNTGRKSTCAPNQMFCFRCRAPKDVKDGTAEYIPSRVGAGNLRACCATCGCQMHRRANLEKQPEIMSGIAVQLRQADQRIKDTSEPCANCASNIKDDKNAETQPSE
ncbi:MAG: helix-turn-helix domain-containing protein [Hyphomicrobiaceae bacterium]